MDDGVDPEDLAQIREHALKSGLDASYVDEFLPPYPVSMGQGHWAWLLKPVEVDGAREWQKDLPDDDNEG
jgi:hypothetical protein